MNVSELLSRTSDYLGRPTQDKLSLGKTLPFLLDSINFYGIDLQLSDENWLLQQQSLTPSTRESIVSATNFSVPVAVEVKDASSTDESDWVSVPIVNLTDLTDISRDGTKAVAFYGSPAYMKWSWNPEDSVPFEAKLWYEPLMEEPTALTASPQMSQAFHSMVAIRTALLCAPFLSEGSDQQLVTTLTAQLSQWESKWRTWIQMDRNSKPIQKRDFRGARAYRRGEWTL